MNDYVDEQVNQAVANTWNSSPVREMTQQLYRHTVLLRETYYKTEPLEFIARFNPVDIPADIFNLGQCKLWGLDGVIGIDGDVKPGEYKLSIIIKVM